MQAYVFVGFSDDVIQIVRPFVGPNAKTDAEQCFYNYTHIRYCEYVDRIEKGEHADFILGNLAGSHIYVEPLNITSPLHTMLELSTAHVSPETLKFLGEQAQDDSPVLITYEKDVYGYFVLILPNDDLSRSDVPKDLLGIIHYAKEHDFNWIMFDCDALTLPDLPVYDYK